MQPEAKPVASLEELEARLLPPDLKPKRATDHPRLRCAFCGQEPLVTGMEALPDEIHAAYDWEQSKLKNLWRFVFKGDVPLLPPPEKGMMVCWNGDCPIYGIMFTQYEWLMRDQHAQKVCTIPLDEPIIVLRASDALVLVTIYTWIDKAEKFQADVSKETIAKVTSIADAMQLWQRDNPNRFMTEGDF